MVASTSELCGWIEDQDGIGEFAGVNGTVATMAGHLIAAVEKRDTFLWRPLLQVHPSWRRGAQKIGDCFIPGTLVRMNCGAKKRIELIEPGEMVLTPLGNTKKVIDVIRKPFDGTVVTVDNFRTTCTATPDHKFHGDKNKRREAGRLIIGESLQTIDGLRKIRQTSGRAYKGFVYCLTVEDDHCFYANDYAVDNCVAWGAELVVTMLLAIQALKGSTEWITEAATEPIYGGARVEARGRTRGGRSDGAMGFAAAKWLRDWGALLRIDYSKITSNREHDLRRYSGRQKAKDWGDWGCGGQHDKGSLDNVAKKHPVAQVVQVHGGNAVMQAAASIESGYPISIASMAGFGSMKRNSEGIVRRSGRWAHQMMLGGVKWVRNEPRFRCFQSWGVSCSGPDPGIEDKAVSDCSWWITPEDAEWIFRTGDCWAFSDVTGFPVQKIDWQSEILKLV